MGKIYKMAAPMTNFPPDQEKVDSSKRENLLTDLLRIKICYLTHAYLTMQEGGCDHLK